MKIFLIPLTVLAMSIQLYANSDTKLSYQSFVDYAKSGKIKSLEISDFGIDDMKAIVVKDDKDVEYLVDKPYRAGEDIVFIDFLKENNIQYEITEKNYSSASNIWKSMLPALGIFLLPCLFMFVLMILVIVTMIRAGRVERLLEKIQNNKIEHEDSYNSDSTIAKPE